MLRGVAPAGSPAPKVRFRPRRLASLIKLARSQAGRLSWSARQRRAVDRWPAGRHGARVEIGEKTRRPAWSHTSGRPARSSPAPEPRSNPTGTARCTCSRCRTVGSGRPDQEAAAGRRWSRMSTSRSCVATRRAASFVIRSLPRLAKHNDGATRGEAFDRWGSVARRPSPRPAAAGPLALAVWTAAPQRWNKAATSIATNATNAGSSLPRSWRPHRP